MGVGTSREDSEHEPARGFLPVGAGQPPAVEQLEHNSAAEEEKPAIIVPARLPLPLPSSATAGGRKTSAAVLVPKVRKPNSTEQGDLAELPLAYLAGEQTAMRAISHDMTRRRPSALAISQRRVSDEPLSSSLISSLRRRFSAPLPISTGVNMSELISPDNPAHSLNTLPDALETVRYSRTESQIKQNKLALCAPVCSSITPFLFVGGKLVAENREVLREHGITHVVNCATLVCPSFFEEDEDALTYLKLNMHDSKDGEDVSWFIYQVIDFIERARQSDGRVLVHCVQGVSRSCALAIAYIMWSRQISYRDAFDFVKRCRPICSPNIAFICNLVEWDKQRKSTKSYVYRIASHAAHDPHSLVPKLCRRKGEYLSILVPRPDRLAPNGSFVMVLFCAVSRSESSCNVLVWHGEHTTEKATGIAEDFALALCRVEGLAMHPQSPIVQGHDSILYELLGHQDEQESSTVVDEYPDLPRPNGESLPPDRRRPEGLCTLSLPIDAHRPGLGGPPPLQREEAEAADMQMEAPHGTRLVPADQPRLFNYEFDEGRWEEIPNYEDLDLVHDALLLLFAPESARHTSLPSRHYLWTGKDCLSANAIEIAQAGVGLPTSGEFAGILDPPGGGWRPELVVTEDAEPEEFWALFNKGMYDDDDDDEEDDENFQEH